jgi:hypothetical protein
MESATAEKCNEAQSQQGISRGLGNHYGHIMGGTQAGGEGGADSAGSVFRDRAEVLIRHVEKAAAIESNTCG